MIRRLTTAGPEPLVVATRPVHPTILAAVGILLAVGGLIGGSAAQGMPIAPAAPAAPAATTVSDAQAAGTALVVSTTPNRTDLLRTIGTYPAGATLNVASGARITVDTTRAGQPITGFGASLTHSSAQLLAGLSATERRRVLLQLFDPAGPVRLSVVRIPFGTSDFATGTPYTFDDMPRGQTDWALAQLSTARDAAQLRPVLREIRAINPKVVIVASPWSAPAWLKDSGSLYGGTLRADARAVPTYARYLARALDQYRAASVPIDYITPQNEPQIRWWGDYPRMFLSTAQESTLITALAGEIRASGLPTRILGFDHNWSLHESDLAAVPAGTDPELDRPARLLAGPAGSSLAGIAYHCYAGDSSAQAELHRAYPTASIWVTECSGTRSATPETTFADTVYHHGRGVLIPALRDWASAVMTWNLALDPAGGPHAGGCTTCTGVVTVANRTTSPQADYYVLAHAARFVPRGSVRVASSVDSAQMEQVAFRTPTGEIVVLVHHGGWQAKSITVAAAGRTYQVPVAPWSLTTIRIRP